VCGSRIEPDGKVVITTPSPGCVPGQVLYVIGSPSEFAMGDRPDWVLRLLDPPANGGKPGNEGPDTAEAEMALAVRMGLVDEAEALEGRA
jgi:hypothetical protein